MSASELSHLTRESTDKLFHDTRPTSLIRDRSIELIAAEGVSDACRCGDHLRLIEEVATVAEADRNEIRLGFRVLNQVLDLTL